MKNVLRHLIFGAITFASTLLASTEHTLSYDFVVATHGTVQIVVPERPLATGSVRISSTQYHTFSEWPIEEVAHSYHLLKAITGIWEQSGTVENQPTSQHLIYGRQNLNQSTTATDSFYWEVVPYYRSSLGFLGRLIQQIKVLWGIVFGASRSSLQTIAETRDIYEERYKNFHPVPAVFDETIGQDPFCNPEQIEKQKILEGKCINVLFNHAPIGFGGERLHFLIVPKSHKVAFKDLSEEEYQEAIAFSKALINHFTIHRNHVHDVHLFHKTGIDAGQTVPHWHMHVIFSSSESQAMFGKLTVLKNMLFGSSPMNDIELKERVDALKSEFAQQKNIHLDYDSSKS